MSITYPLALPSQGFAAITVYLNDVVGIGESPFSFSQQVQHLGGQRWEADVQYPSLLDVTVIEAVIVFLASLKGLYGSFLMPVDPLRTTPRGTWAGAPVVNGPHAAGAATLALKAFTAGATVKAGDYVQVGTGSSSRVHKALADATASGGGAATLDIWPNLRAALADNAAIVTASPKCAWRLKSNLRRFDVARAQAYGIAFSCTEAL